MSKQKSFRGFTLIELLLVIAIIGVITSMLMVALADSANNAKISRAKVQIRKINDLIMDRWESFETRAVPFRLDPAANTLFQQPRNAARIRLYAMRELMRLELPERYTDILAPNNPVNNPTFTSAAIDVEVPMSDGTTVTFNLSSNSLNSFYRSQVSGSASVQYQGAECLYLILLAMQDEFGNALDAFNDSEIGDVDQDGMREILDPWGSPIEFLRWAPGYSELATDFDGNWTAPPVRPTAIISSPVQSGDPVNDPDPMDPLLSDPRYLETTLQTDDPFRLVPLIYSAGPDRQYDVWRRDEVDHDFHDFGSGSSQLVDYTDPSFYPPDPLYGVQMPNDPYWGVGLANDTTPSVGFRVDWYSDGPILPVGGVSRHDYIEGYFDNIDNHFGFEN